ncbi:glycosyltransferase [Massilia polaris]|nr:glycosyltransferase [Massilia polaris]
MVKRILMIAYHYPPMRGSSGIQRTLKFSQYLGNHGWQPTVLSAHPRAYANTGDDQLGDIPQGMQVHRAFAFDTARHLSLFGRYPGWLALPDRWVSWWFGAVPAGLKLIRRQPPDVIWSTYPIATAHLVGLALHRLTGIPWVADMRDPMTDDDYPANPFLRRLYRWIERQTALHCELLVCTTRGAAEVYRARFPGLPAAKFEVIENGYDEENFINAEAIPLPHRPDGRLRLVHSGVIYPSERDPTALFQALASLLASGAIAAANFHLTLRATGHDAYIAAMIDEHQIGSVVSLAPHIAYRDALAEMLGADGLLILQAANCNHQVPAKLYEYLRARRPVLALTDPAGDTAATLRTAGVDTIAPLDCPIGIAQAIIRFIGLISSGGAPLATPETVQQYSRQARTSRLSDLLDAAIAPSTHS